MDGIISSIFVFRILHPHPAGGGGKYLSHSDLNVSPQPPPCPLAWPATTNASPRPPKGGRLDNIVGPTQDTRKGPNGRKLDAPGQPTARMCRPSIGTPPIRYLANTGSLNHPYDASRIGTRPTPSQPPTASIACLPVRVAVVSYTHTTPPLAKAGHRVTATQQKSQDTSTKFITILRIRCKGSRSPREIPPPLLRTSCTTTHGNGRIG